MFAAMGGMLVVSLSIPEAFGNRGVLFGCAYFFVRRHAARALCAEYHARLAPRRQATWQARSSSWRRGFLLGIRHC
jgi:low temperature requirement protein LtrA